MVQHSILKNHKHSKMIETHFLNDLLQKSLLALSKSMTSNFVVVVSVLLVVILAGVRHICAFLLEVVTLLGAITDKWV